MTDKLPTDAQARKAIPIATGFVDYFPDAMAAVAELSRIGNDQHNPGKPLHWDRSKSGDESDALMRHFVQRGTLDTDGVRHSAKVAWRAMAMLKKEIEQSPREEIDLSKGYYDRTILDETWTPHDGESLTIGVIDKLPAFIDLVYADGYTLRCVKLEHSKGWLHGTQLDMNIVAWRPAQ
jgi:hypothetical protein